MSNSTFETVMNESADSNFAGGRYRISWERWPKSWYVFLIFTFECMTRLIFFSGVEAPKPIFKKKCIALLVCQEDILKNLL